MVPSMLQRSMEMARQLTELPLEALRTGGRPAENPFELWISFFPTAPMFGVRWFWADRLPDSAWMAMFEGPEGFARFGWSVMRPAQVDVEVGTPDRHFETTRIIDVTSTVVPVEVPQRAEAPAKTETASDEPTD